MSIIGDAAVAGAMEDLQKKIAEWREEGEESKWILKYLEIEIEEIRQAANSGWY